jgi:hypothetical protein
MEAMLGISLFLIIAYVFSSTQLEMRADRFCLEVRGWRVRGRRQGTGGRNGPNNVCTCE